MNMKMNMDLSKVNFQFLLEQASDMGFQMEPTDCGSSFFRKCKCHVNGDVHFTLKMNITMFILSSKSAPQSSGVTGGTSAGITRVNFFLTRRKPLMGNSVSQ